MKLAEQNYQEYWYMKNLVSFRVGFMINVFLLGIIAENFVFPKELPTDLVIPERIIRDAFLIACWLGLFIFSFFKEFKHFDQISIACVAFVTGVAIVVVGFFAPLLWFGLLGLYLSTFFLIKLRFQYALAVTAVVHIAFVIIALVKDATALYDTVVLLFSIFFASLGSSYYLETYSRKNFIEEQILHKEQERLNIEQSKSEELLVNLLPVSIARQLKLMKVRDNFRCSHS